MEQQIAYIIYSYGYFLIWIISVYTRLGFLKVTAHMNLLAVELNNCCDKVNALDWKGCN
jgi:hypothetical protein